MAEFFQSAYNAVSSLQAEAAILACWGAFALLSAATIVLALASPAFRRSGKRPFCALVNAFAVVTLAFALMKYPVSFSLLLAAAFWCVGYLLYGLTVLLSRPKRGKAARVAAQPSPPADCFTPEARPAKPSVRTEHALSVTEKLLSKGLGKGDRQETERIKSALTFLKAKGELSPEDNERLNESFNSLLKLMAKYGL